LSRGIFKFSKYRWRFGKKADIMRAAPEKGPKTDAGDRMTEKRSMFHE
jgi:hypothetical protein